MPISSIAPPKAELTVNGHRPCRRFGLIIKKTILAALLLLLPSLACPRAEEACLHYDPAIVQLSGRVVLRVFPGPPNYENTKKGDRPEKQALLDLDHPICVSGDPNSEINSEDEHDQQMVTLVPAPGMNLDSYAGARVRIEGKLFHAHTGHHRTPVLITVLQISRIGRSGR